MSGSAADQSPSTSSEKLAPAGTLHPSGTGSVSLEFVCQSPGGRGFAIQHSALFLSLVTWPGSWGGKGSRLPQAQRLRPSLPAPERVKLATAGIFLPALAGGGEQLAGTRGPGHGGAGGHLWLHLGVPTG